MKIGRERPRLSARLAQETRAIGDETMRTGARETKQQVAQTHKAAAANGLPGSSLPSLRNDCASISSAAFNTIEADMAALVRSSRDMIGETSAQIARDLRSIRHISRFGPLMTLVLALTTVVATLSLSFWFSRAMLRETSSVSLTTIGLIPYRSGSGLIIGWDETRLKLGQCGNGKTTVPCLVPVTAEQDRTQAGR